MAFSAVGWFVVHWLNGRRIRLAEHRIVTNQLVELLDEIEHQAILCWTTTYKEETKAEFVKLNSLFKRFSRRLSIQQQENDSIQDQFLQLKRVCTGEDFESSKRLPCEINDPKIEDIGSKCEALNRLIAPKASQPI